jgi:hypothetical protein
MKTERGLCPICGKVIECRPFYEFENITLPCGCVQGTGKAVLSTSNAGVDIDDDDLPF